MLKVTDLDLQANSPTAPTAYNALLLQLMV
jgi:hypothetical protein